MRGKLKKGLSQSEITQRSNWSGDDLDIASIDEGEKKKKEEDEDYDDDDEEGKGKRVSLKITWEEKRREEKERTCKKCGERNNQSSLFSAKREPDKTCLLPL